MSGISIERRLSTTVSLATALGACAIFVATALLIDHEVNELLDSGLQESAELMVALADRQVEFMGDGQVILAAAPHDEKVIWQLIDANGLPVIRSHMSPATAINPQRAPGFSNIGGWRVFTTATSRPGFVLQTADSLPERHAIRLSAIALEAAVALVCALVTLTILRRMVRAELRPLRDFAAAVEQLDPPASSALEPTGREELEPIRASVETLTQRLLIRLDAEKAFSAHAAHALRTPLAGIDVQLALAMREASGPQAQHLHHARTGVARLSAVVSALLRLFRAGGSYQRVPLDVPGLIRELGFDQLSVTVTGEGELLGDRDLIAAALINLLANAEQHGGQSVTVHYRADEAGFTLCVTDGGAGMPARQRQEMQLALDEKRSHPNIGMGLELGRLVAEIHGGRLTLPECEDGFRVCLSGRNGTTVAS